MNTCRKSRPLGFSQAATLASSSRQFDICSNISTETTRSNRPWGSNAFISAVMTDRLESPRALASASMEARWEAEFETAVIRDAG